MNNFEIAKAEREVARVKYDAMRKIYSSGTGTEAEFRAAKKELEKADKALEKFKDL